MDLQMHWRSHILLQMHMHVRKRSTSSPGEVAGQRPRVAPGRMLGSSRTMGLPSLVSLVAASMIGAGIFTTSGYALADLGSRGHVMLAWLIGGLIALCGAVSYGALSRRLAESGGEYLFLSRAMHPLLGFVAGWVSLLAGFTGALAFAATALETYLVPDAARPKWLPTGAVATLAIAAGALQHGIHTRWGAWAQNVVVVLKLSGLVAFVVFGCFMLFRPDGAWHIAPAWEAQTRPTLLTFATSVMWISMSYSGFNAATYITEEARDAHRTVPRAMVLATATVATLYLGLNVVFLYSIPPGELAGKADVAVLAASTIGGPRLTGVVRAIIISGLYTSISSLLMAGPRVYAKMAADGVLPSVFKSTGCPPRAAVAFQGLLAIGVVWVTGLQELLSYLGLTLSVCAALTVTTIFVLRMREGRDRMPVWGYPVVPGAFVIGTLTSAGLAGYRRPWDLAAACATFLSGALLFRLNAGHRRRGEDHRYRRFDP